MAGRIIVGLIGILLVSEIAAAQVLPAPPPTPRDDLVYDTPFYDAAAHDAAISTPERLLGMPLGQRAATHAEILRCFETWERESQRAALVRYATSYEGRDLVYMVISAPRHLAGQEDIRKALATMADPRGRVSEARQLAARVPAVAWLGYAIHGDEMSGADAALGVVYHLLASNEDEVGQLLEDCIVIVDPLMNPDGRDRFITQIQEMRGRVPNSTPGSITHHGAWSAGRTNHYLFDLNRDWIFAVHPETRGRIAAVDLWNPLMFVDAHEMGGLDTYLFSPSRHPVNPNLPERRFHWWDVFAGDQAAAFDTFGWRYYTGEWNEEWYPGYSSSWAGFRGAVGILYEQAGVAHDGMNRPEGTVLTYRESVHHQYVSSIANLQTFHANHDALRREFVEERINALSSESGFADRIFAILPTENRGRLNEFVELMRLQGFDVSEAREDFTAEATDHLGRRRDSVTVPAGTILIPNRQPDGHLISAMLEFDPQMAEDFLQTERRSLLRDGDSKLYDVTAWNLTMMFGLEALELHGAEPDMRGYGQATRRAGLDGSGTDVAFVIDGADDRSVAAAGHLMERGRQVRVADRDFTLDGESFSRGSLVIQMVDNPGGERDFRADIEIICARTGLRAVGIGTGLGDGDLPDLGGEHFQLLNRPRIAIVGRDGVSAYDYGSSWFTIDHRLGMQATYLAASDLGAADLRPYNVMIIPDLWGGSLSDVMKPLGEWVASGGTLIAVAGAASQLAREEGLGDVRRLRDVLEDLAPYELAVLRAFEGRNASVAGDAIWAHAMTDELDFPWASGEESQPSPEELERRDAWQRLFMPQGAMVAGRTDDEHWLTFGCGDVLPVLVGRGPVLMADQSVDAPVRLGVYEVDPAPSDEDAEDAPMRRAGWSLLPDGQRLRLRMSGLLWPEAQHRLVNSAWVTRERHGTGQIILFASPPTFRGSAAGMTRVFTNAVVYGPGFGTSQPIE